MPETPPDKLMGWLVREEEEIGLGGSILSTADVEACREKLRSELAYEPTEAQVELMRWTSRVKYEGLPQIGTRVLEYETKWGVQYRYQDIFTGRFVAGADVASKMRFLGLWPAGR